MNLGITAEKRHDGMARVKTRLEMGRGEQVNLRLSVLRSIDQGPEALLYPSAPGQAKLGMMHVQARVYGGTECY